MGKIKAAFKIFMQTAKTLGKINLKGEKRKVLQNTLEEEISISTKMWNFSALLKAC